MEPRYQDERDWKDLLKYPSKLFGFSYVYVLVVFIGLGLLYLKNINNTGLSAVAPQVLKDSTAFVTDIPLQAPRVLAPVDVQVVGVVNDSLLARGRALFKPTCSPCHGEAGMGDGPSAPTLNPKPRNFHLLDGWKNGSKVSQMYKTLQEGIPGSGMASFNYIAPADLFAMIHYVRTLAAPQPIDSPDELKALDAKYQLAKGMNIPGQIPISEAIVKTVKEVKPTADRIEKAVAAVRASADPGAVLLRRVVADERKAVVSALHAQGKSADEFFRIVTTDPVRAGFTGAAARVSAADWSLITNYLLNLVREG